MDIIFKGKLILTILKIRVLNLSRKTSPSYLSKKSYKGDTSSRKTSPPYLKRKNPNHCIPP